MQKLDLIQFGCVVFITALALFAFGMFLFLVVFNSSEISEEKSEQVRKEILETQSVLTFKDAFSEYREEFEDEHNGLKYTLQAQNAKTGNILSLFVHYYQHGIPFQSDRSEMRESLSCKPNDDKVVYDNRRSFYGYPHAMKNLFIDETILNSTCLDDDWKPIAVVLEENTR